MRCIVSSMIQFYIQCKILSNICSWLPVIGWINPLEYISWFERQDHVLWHCKWYYAISARRQTVSWRISLASCFNRCPLESLLSLDKNTSFCSRCQNRLPLEEKLLCYFTGLLSFLNNLFSILLTPVLMENNPSDVYNPSNWSFNIIRWPPTGFPIIYLMCSSANSVQCKKVKMTGLARLHVPHVTLKLPSDCRLQSFHFLLILLQ